MINHFGDIANLPNRAVSDKVLPLGILALGAGGRHLGNQEPLGPCGYLQGTARSCVLPLRQPVATGTRVNKRRTKVPFKIQEEDPAMSQPCPYYMRIPNVADWSQMVAELASAADI